jgi:DNA-binding cell septation regulator SpoVG
MSEVITEVRVYPLSKPAGTLLANASITVAGAFAIKVKVVETSKGKMVSVPSQRYEKDGEAKYSDLAFPITQAAREEMIEKVIAEYEKQVEGGSSNSSSKKKKGSGLPF